MKTFIVAIAGLIALASTGLQAQDLPNLDNPDTLKKAAQKIETTPKNRSEAVDILYTSGYLEGYTAAIQTLQKTGLAAKTVELPAELTIRDIALAYLLYVQTHPESSQRPTSLVVLDALQTTYPAAAPATAAQPIPPTPNSTAP